MLDAIKLLPRHFTQGRRRHVLDIAARQRGEQPPPQRHKTRSRSGLENALASSFIDLEYGHKYIISIGERQPLPEPECSISHLSYCILRRTQILPDREASACPPDGTSYFQSQGSAQ